MNPTFHFFFAASLICITSNMHANDTKKVALEIIASLSSDIAELMINQKQQKDPHVTKQHVISIIRHMTDVVAIIVEKIQERRQTRSIDINDQELEIALEYIAQKLLAQ